MSGRFTFYKYNILKFLDKNSKILIPAYTFVGSLLPVILLENNYKFLDISKKYLSPTFNEIKKKELENIIHPNVRSQISDFINNSESPYCIVMVPLIFETNSSDNYDRILVIDCDVKTQIKRSSLRDNQSNKDIQRIISSQATRDERLSIADDVVLNTSSFEYLKNEIFKLPTLNKLGELSMIILI